jgi:hypothetical protein
MEIRSIRQKDSVRLISLFGKKNSNCEVARQEDEILVKEKPTRRNILRNHLWQFKSKNI